MSKNASYFDFTSSLPKPLTEEETSRYFQLARSGDENAKNKLRVHNLRLVVFVINKNFLNAANQYTTIDIDDFMSAGAIGLMKAINTFDIEKNIKFATYATRCIVNEGLMILRKRSNREVVHSLDAPITTDHDGNEINFADIIDNNEDITAGLEQRETYAILKESLKKLKPTEKKVIELYYFNDERLTHKEIGDLLGFSQSYICRVEKKAVEKLGIDLENQGLGYLKKSTQTEYLKNMSSLDRAIFYANEIIDSNITKEELAKKLGVSLMSISKSIALNLPNSKPELYKELIRVLENQKQEKKQKREETRLAKKEQKAQEKLIKQKAREQYPNTYERKPFVSAKKPELKGEKQMERLLLSIFPNHTEDHIRAALAKLPAEEREMLLLRYPLDAGKQHKLRIIAEQYNIKPQSMHAKIVTIIGHVFNILGDKTPKEKKTINTAKKKKNNFFDLFPDFTEEEVLTSVNNLEEKRKILLELKHGLNGHEKIGVREIAKRIGCKQSEVNSKVDYAEKLVMKQLTKKLDLPVIEEIPIITEEQPKLIQEVIETDIVNENQIEDNSITFINDRFPTPVSLDFEKNKGQIKMLINMLNDPEEQTILLLRLGYVRNQFFTEFEISQFLNIEETEVHNIIQRALSNIMGISAITMTGIESARQQIQLMR